jgi:hypothetical protein
VLAAIEEACSFREDRADARAQPDALAG